MNVLFLTQTDQIGASARYRVYQYLDYFKKEGIGCAVSPAVSARVLDKYNRNNFNPINKLSYYSSIIFNRITDFKRLHNFNCVFLQRDILVHAYPFIEKLIARKQKNIIFDFDDALALYPNSSRTGVFFRPFWDKRKIERIIKLSKHVIVGNIFLEKYARNFTKNITIIPTSVDLDLYKQNERHDRAPNEIFRIGWMGSQGTFSYVKAIFPSLVELNKKYNIVLIIVGACGPNYHGLNIEYKDWNLNAELSDLKYFDVGIMPLSDDAWSWGKSATKLLQYMAVGIPAVCSPIGINSEIIRDGENGFFASTRKEWIEKISLLIEERQLSERIINNARSTVERFYSVQINAPILTEIIKNIGKENA